MKKVIASLLLTMLILVAYSSKSFATKRINVNTTVTGTYGGSTAPCTYAIIGWVDVDMVFGFPPMKVVHYDLTISPQPPCTGSTIHITGLARDLSGSSTSTSTSYAWEMSATQNNISIPLSTIGESLLSAIRLVIINASNE